MKGLGTVLEFLFRHVLYIQRAKSDFVKLCFNATCREKEKKSSFQSELVEACRI